MSRSLLFAILLANCFFSQVYPMGYLCHNDIKMLVNSYHELVEKRDAETQKAYFDAFPDTWLDFVRAEAFMNDIESEQFVAYIEEFDHLEAIEDTTYCKKLINLCIGAKLDADGSSFLQTLLHTKMISNIDGSPSSGSLLTVMLSLLSHKLKGEMISFWNFYWSSLYFEEDYGKGNDESPYFPYLQKIVKETHPQMTIPMELAYYYFHHVV